MIRDRNSGEYSEEESIVSGAPESGHSMEKTPNLSWAAKGEDTSEPLDTAPLIKISTLARAVQETVPTIRRWTKEGLLRVFPKAGNYRRIHARPNASITVRSRPNSRNFS